jgi:hypothetical protein
MELQKQQNSFNNELQKFNSTTKELKELIRERCGSRGREWYHRLDDRTRKRRAA